MIEWGVGWYNHPCMPARLFGKIVHPSALTVSKFVSVILDLACKIWCWWHWWRSWKKWQRVSERVCTDPPSLAMLTVFLFLLTTLTNLLWTAKINTWDFFQPPVFEVVWTLINVVSVYAVFMDFKEITWCEGAQNMNIPLYINNWLCVSSVEFTIVVLTNILFVI